ncbi:MAG TPA: tetratricopeptide repeat protein [Terriglobales bacterium]|nr:tetratricopeptide repeat protein [Terriglobales bacterium]
MTNGSPPATVSGSGWKPQQVYLMSAVCLLLGIGLGYFSRGSGGRSASKAGDPSAQSSSPSPTPGAMHQMPSLEQMKQMADKKAEPLLAKLKTDPNNADLLIQTGRIYEATHQFKDAAAYLQRSLAVDPKNTAIRNEMASCLYYSGDAAGAVSALEESLKNQPTDANSLFNLGLIRWQGQSDAAGAITAWEKLLKTNPKLESNKRSQVEKLIADARQHGKTKLTGAKSQTEEH